MVIPVDQRLPADGGETAIDRPDLLLDLFFSVIIGRYRIPAGNDIQDEHHLFTPLGITLEKIFETLETLHQSLRIVETVDGENDLLVLEIGAHLIAVFFYLGIVATVMEFVIIDTYREQVDPDQPVHILQG